MKSNAILVLGATLAASGLLAGCGEEKAVASVMPIAPVAAPVAAPAAPAVVAPVVLPAAPVAPAAPVGTPYDPKSATATISIKATLKGNAPKMRPVKFDADPKCGEQHKEEVPDQAVIAKDGKLANVIGYLSKGTDKWTYTAPTDAVVLDQKACLYTPHVFTVWANQPITIRNSDPVMHNIHAMPKVNAEFNHSQLKDSKDLTEKFAKDEVGVKFKCDVHGWMGAWVGVFSHPFHGVTNADGVIEMKVPPGEYEVSVWHEYGKFAKPEPQKVTVAAGETKAVEFVYEVK